MPRSPRLRSTVATLVLALVMTVQAGQGVGEGLDRFRIRTLQARANGLTSSLKARVRVEIGPDAEIWEAARDLVPEGAQVYVIARGDPAERRTVSVLVDLLYPRRFILVETAALEGLGRVATRQGSFHVLDLAHEPRFPLDDRFTVKARGNTFTLWEFRQ